MAKRKRTRKPNYGKRVKRDLTPDLYPTIYCLAENLYIAFSKKPLRKIRKQGSVRYKKKVYYHYFVPPHVEFRDGYYIDMTKFRDGELVRCPNCRCEVDFRAFPSNTVPKFAENKRVEDNKSNPPEELPST
jgi:hypothetical protein